MINIISQSGKTTVYLKEFVIDTRDDVKDLPVTIPEGSSALCLEDSSVWVLGTKGWKEI